MASILEQLDSDESILLMYLARELPEAQRLKVEQRVAAEPALRAKLEELGAMHESLSGALESVPAQPMTLKHAAMVRQIRRQIDQWHARQLAAQAAAARARDKGLRYPWYAYPLAMAAAIMIAFVVWWKNVDSNYAPMIADNSPSIFGPGGYMNVPREVIEHNQLMESLDELAAVTSLQHYEQQFAALEILGDPFGEGSVTP